MSGEPTHRSLVWRRVRPRICTVAAQSRLSCATIGLALVAFGLRRTGGATHARHLPRSAGARPPGACHGGACPACCARRARHGAGATLARHLRLAGAGADHGRPRPGPARRPKPATTSSARSSSQTSWAATALEKVNDHEMWGDRVIIPVSIMWVAYVAFFIAHRAGTPRWPLRCLGWLAAAAAVIAIGFVIVTGEAGSTAVWNPTG